MDYSLPQRKEERQIVPQRTSSNWPVDTRASQRTGDPSETIGSPTTAYLALIVIHRQPRDDEGQRQSVRRAAIVATWPEAVWADSPTECVALLPVHDTSEEAVQVATVDALGLAHMLTQLADSQIVYVSEYERDKCFYQTVTEARANIRLAAVVGMRGAINYEQMTLERMLLATPAMAEQFAGMLTPLHTGPDLLLTLDTLYENNLDRSRTAKKLFVHRHTINYRLERIEQAVGINPTSPRGVQLLKTALTAHRLKAANMLAQANRGNGIRQDDDQQQVVYE